MRTLSPTAMLVRAGQLHDDDIVKMDEVAKRDFYRIMDIIPGDEAALDAAFVELAAYCEPITRTPIRTASPALIIAKATAPHVTTFTDRSTGATCELFHNPAYGAFYVVRWNADDQCGPSFTTRAAAIGGVERELRASAFLALSAAA